MSSLNGRVAAVTGAGSGIGRALALELSRRGARVAIADIDEAGLAATAARLTAGPGVHSATVDVADRAAVDAWATEVVAHFGVVHQIYNNAGISSGRTILEISYEQLERVLAIDLWGVIHGTKAFLPHLIASGDGHVINISSLNGLFAQPSLSAYVTAKFAVRGFTETLRAEMLAARAPVSVSVVHPGGVKTQIANNALRNAAEIGIEITDAERARIAYYNEKLLKMDPARAAEIILDGVQRGRSRIRVGNDAVAVDLLSRLLPAQAPRIAATLTRLGDRALGSR